MTCILTIPHFRPWFLFLVGFGLLGCERHGDVSHPFPTVDRSRLTISLQRSACFGACPNYTVTISGNGRAVFETDPESVDDLAELHRRHSPNSGVLVPGRHVVQIAPSAIDTLLDQFRRANFFSLKNEYRAAVTDSPTYVLTIDTGHGRKQVIDYVGERAQMPASVTTLEKAVDNAAGTSRWVDGGEGLVAWLEATGFDFSSLAATQILLAGVDQAADETLIELVRRGTPLAHTVSEPSIMRGTWQAEPAGVIAIEGAIRHGRAPLFRLLEQKGWLARLGRVRAGQAFADLGARCSIPMLKAYLSAGLQIDASKSGDVGDYETGRSALGMLTSNTYCDYDSQRQHAMVAALLAHGANPNHEDARGETPLFGADVDTAKMLLAHGADPNHRNDEGETPIFGTGKAELDLLIAHGADPTAKDHQGRSAVLSAFKDDTVMRLLEAGADPRGTREDGRTLRVIATQNHLTQTLKWLDSRHLP